MLQSFMALSHIDIFLMQFPFISACNRLCCNPFEVEAERKNIKSFWYLEEFFSIIIPYYY